jgi:WD40 repeat protein
VGSGVGIQSFSEIPIHQNNACRQKMYISYGGKGRNDMNAFLIVQGSPTSPKWKCRLPEQMDKSGLVASQCGQYIFGAGKSGKCYCWSIYSEGELRKVWTAHNRAVQSMVFSDCGSYLVTGGADGIVSVWSIMEIISQERTGKSFLSPIKTWSEHHLPISAMHSLPSSRVVSVSRDRQVIIMELFSGKTLAKISMPTSINSITADASGHQLYLGSHDGTIYSIDLDSYAIAFTAESATVVSNRDDSRARTSQLLSLGEKSLDNTIDGKEGNSPNAPTYISELRGHQRSVSCLAIIDGEEKLLVSGSDDGSVRIWDIQSRCCTKVFNPWSSSANDFEVKTEASKNQRVFPCSTITIMSRDEFEKGLHGSLLSSNRPKQQKKEDDMSELVMPLQRYPKRIEGRENLNGETLTCISKSRKDESMAKECDEFKNYSYSDESPQKKKIKLNTRTSPENTSKPEIDLLKDQLAAANEENERWQKVNNRLVQKLKSR